MERKKNYLVIALIACGIFLRLLFLGKNDLWYDEAFTLLIVKKDLFFASPEFWNLPLYYVLTKYWVPFFGSSEFSLRFLPAFFSFASLPVLYILAKKIFDEKTALIALVLQVFSPFHLWYAQEACHYSLPLFIGLSSTYFLYAASKGNKAANFTLFIVLTSLGLYSNYYYIPFLAAQLLAVFIYRRASLHEKVFSLVPFIFFLPWLPLFMTRLDFISRGFWIPKPSLNSLAITFENFILGYNGTRLLYLFCDIFLLSAIILTFIYLRGKNAKKADLLFCLSLLLFPIVATYLFSQYFMPVYLDRGFLLLSPYLYIVTAFALAHINKKALKIAIFSIAGLTLLIGDIRYFSNQMFQPNDSLHHTGVCLKKPLKPLANFIKGIFQKDRDILIFGNHFPSMPLRYYVNGNEKNFPGLGFYAYDKNHLDTNTRRPTQNIYKGIGSFIPKAKIKEILDKTKGRVFFIGCDWARSGQLDENSIKIKEYLERDIEVMRLIKLSRELEFDGIRLFIYERRDVN